MSYYLPEAAWHLLPDEFINDTAHKLRETETNIRKAFKGAIPAVWAGLLHQFSKAGEAPILNLLKSVLESGAVHHLKELPGFYINKNKAGRLTEISNLIPGWLQFIFRGKQINILNAVTVYSEIKSSSAVVILNLAVITVLDPLARYAEENKSGEADLAILLQSCKSNIVAAVPAGFNLSGSLGINNLELIGMPIITAIPKPHNFPKKYKRKNRIWIGFLFFLCIIGGLLWFFSQRTGVHTGMNTALKDTSTKQKDSIPGDTIKSRTISGWLDSLTGNFIYDQGIAIDLKLPDCSVIHTGQNSTEARLHKMLSDSSWRIDTTDRTPYWVTFDRVYFETGKAVFTIESHEQLKNIAAILKNFPGSAIILGGYTDNTGDTTFNKNISGDRAKAVMNELLKLGTGSHQISEAVGYGPEHPVCPANNTPECKARNRRVDLKLAGK